MLKNGFLLGFLLISPTVAWAADCMSVKDNDERLKCYDNAATQSGMDVADRVDLIDLIVDMKKLKGRKVVVSGTAFMFMGTLMLSKSGSASEMVHVSTKRLSRTDQKAIVENCGSRHCNVTVSGIVGDIVHNEVFHKLGIDAQRVLVATE